MGEKLHLLSGEFRHAPKAELVTLRLKSAYVAPGLHEHPFLFERSHLSRHLILPLDHKKGAFPMMRLSRELTNCHHDPVVQMLPDHVNFAESRVAQRCLVNIYQGTRGTRFGAEATRTFREARLHPWFTPKLIPPFLPVFLLRCTSHRSPLRMPVLCDRVEARQMRGKPQAIPIEEHSTRANEDS